MKITIRKKFFTILILAAVMTVGVAGNTYAISTKSATIGKLTMTTASGEGYKTATAKTTISTASSPATGYTAQAILKTTNENGTVKTTTRTDSASSVSASRTATEPHVFTKAKGTHKELYYGSVILTETTSISA